MHFQFAADYDRKVNVGFFSETYGKDMFETLQDDNLH